MSGRIAAGFGLLICIFAGGCGGCDGEGLFGFGPRLQMHLTPTSASIAQGSTGHVVVGIDSKKNSTSDVQLAVSGVPSGVTATLTPQVIPAAANSASLDLAVSSSAALGTSTLTVTATEVADS